jgi:superfamily II DNA helicase RecQ
MANLLTRQHGHSLATAARNYGTKTVSSCDWQMASLTYQNWLHIDDTTCDDPMRGSSSSSFISSLYPENVDTSEKQRAFILELLGKAYPGSCGSRSDIQINFIEAILLGKSDVVVTGGCGTGKSAAYLVPGLAILMENAGRCVLLLCPQNNVALSATDLCEKAGLRFHLFENSQRTKDFVNNLCDTNGEALSVTVVIATFQYISDSSMFGEFVHVMTKSHRLARVVVDEVHICLSSYSWRSCFNNCGNLRARLGYSVPWAFTTATLPVAALQPYLRFWHCGLRPTVTIRAPMKLAGHVMLTVEPYAHTTGVFKGLRSTLKELFGTRRWLTRRCLILTLSIESANKLARQLNDMKLDLNLEEEDIIQSITSENTTAETRDAVKNAKIIVCTTVISSSMNIPSMDSVIVFKSCYSLADLIQAWGRAGREGQYSRCYLLWCKSSHERMFPKESLDAELSSVGWLRPHERTAELHKTFSPSGVLAFSEDKSTCRRIQIFKAFDGDSEDRPPRCLDLDDAGGPDLLCDCCRLTLTEGIEGELNSSNFGDSPTDQRVGDDEKGANDGDDDDDADETNDEEEEEEEVEEERQFPEDFREASSENLMNEAISRQDNVDDEEFDDEDLVFAPMLDQVHDPASPHVIALFQEMANILDGREGRDLMDACFMCNSKTCNGIKDASTAKGFVCPGRRVLSEATWGYICFGCGGCHDGKTCKYRKTGINPEVPSGIERCFTCFLPQKAQYGASFHAGDAGMSGKSNHCRQRGKALFGLLSASAHLKKEVLHVYRQQASSQINQPPIQVKNTDDGQGFGLFWDWLWERNPLAHGVYNIDVWIHFLLKILKDNHL